MIKMESGMFDFYKAALSGELTTPLCAEYKKAWRLCGDDKEMLMNLAMRQQSIPFVATHAYQGKGLDRNYILSTFGDYINGHVLNDCDNVNGYTYELWVKDNDVVDLKSDVMSFMYCKDLDVFAKETKCNTIYVSNRSNISVSLDGFNHLVVYLFDESSVHIYDADETCSVTVFKYSDEASVTTGDYCFANVKTFNKELKL